MIPKSTHRRLSHWLGIEPDTTGHGEKLAAGLGGMLGILAVLWISSRSLGGIGAATVVASMGASAVLLFAVPHGPLSQPWPLIGGHLLSAAIGVSCQRLVADPYWAAALAVGIAITVMYYSRCVHPPGGATALAAVIGGDPVHALGYQYVLTPIALNVFLLLAMAVAVNALFPWRRYPYRWFAWLRDREREERPEPVPRSDVLSRADLEYALKTLGSYVDITEDDLGRIYQLATRHAESVHLPVEQVRLGGTYSNGRYGRHWSVRQVVDEAGTGPGDLVIYKVLAGEGRRQSGTCSREAFARWAKYPVERNETSWQRVEEEH